MPKAAVRLRERTLLDHALQAVTAELGLELIVLVLPSDPAVHQELAAAGTAAAARTGADVVITTGGTTRTASVASGTHAVAEHAQLKGWDPAEVHVLVHDAARALTPAEVFQRVAEAAEASAVAVVPAVPVTDTIKEVTDSQGPGERAVATLNRAALRAVQTPQGFSLSLLQRLSKHAAAAGEEAGEQFTDEAMIAEHLGVDVVVVPGHPRALKITTETDLITAQGLLDAQQAPAVAEPEAHPPAPRVGIGHDIHAFADADEPAELWLAGLHWPGQRGLAGHSDGDAVAHACCAALFSAAGMGDLGTHFGADTVGTARPEMAGASGAGMLAEAARLVRQAGYRIGSISVQFIGSRPKLAPRREEAQRVLSEAAGAPVAVSATTSDGLGFAGRGEGIMATATAVLIPSGHSALR